MIADLLTAPVSLELGGVRHPIRFTHADLIRIERLAGVDLLATGVEFTARTPARIIAACLQVLGIKAAITPRDLRHVRKALSAGWAASMPDREPERADGKPGATVTWPSAWAQARVMGLSSEEWLGMTPRMMKALSEEYLEQMRQREFMQSRAIAIGANFSACAPRQPFKETDFMLHPWHRQEDPPAQAQTGEDLMRMMGRFRKQPIYCATEEAQRYVATIPSGN